MSKANAKFNKLTTGYNASNKIARLSRTKAIFQKKLDKRITLAFRHCREDKTSKICKILWDDVEECLEEIDVVNQEIRTHTWMELMELES